MTSLAAYIQGRDLVRIERSFDAETIVGFIQAESKGLAVVRRFHDFCDEGYAVIRKADIESVESDEESAFMKRIMEEEGFLDDVKYDRQLPLKSMTALATYFLEAGEHVIIECEGAQDEDAAFFIGEITEIEDAEVWFLGFDALGQWAQDEVAIPVADITMLQFATPYIRIFSKHLTPREDGE
jgi:phosphotransferase system HPr-like phosphotransfer protein